MTNELPHSPSVNVQDIKIHYEDARQRVLGKKLIIEGQANIDELIAEGIRILDSLYSCDPKPDVPNQYHIYDLVRLIRVCTEQEFYISLEGLSFTEVSLLNDYVEQTMRAYYFDVA